MRRAASITWLALIVILVAGPFVYREQARLSVSAPYDPRDLASWLERLSQQQANDPDVRLALAVRSARVDRGPLRVHRKALSRVRLLRPESTAPYLILATLLVPEVPLGRYAEYSRLFPDEAEPAESRISSRGAERRRDIEDTRAALRQVLALDPKNATADYLLAYLALSERRDNDAVALLRSALHKNRWELAERDVNAAVYATNLRILPELPAAVEASDFVTWWPYGLRESLAEMARLIVAMAIRAEGRGDVTDAVFLRRSVMHLGRLMWPRGYTPTDKQHGGEVWEIATSEQLTPDERGAALTGLSRLPSGESKDEEERFALALRRAQTHKLTAYLRDHGYGVIARQIVSTDRQLSRPKPPGDGGPLSEVLNARRRFDNAYIAAFLSLVWLTICALGRLALIVRRQRPHPVKWARWKWALIIGAVVAGATQFDVLLDKAPFVLAVAAVLLLPGPSLMIVAAFVTWRERRKQSALDVGFYQQFWPTAVSVLLPTVALFLILAVAFLAPVASAGQRFIDNQKIMMGRGGYSVGRAFSLPPCGGGDRHPRPTKPGLVVPWRESHFTTGLLRPNGDPRADGREVVQLSYVFIFQRDAAKSPIGP